MIHNIIVCYASMRSHLSCTQGRKQASTILIIAHELQGMFVLNYRLVSVFVMLGRVLQDYLDQES